MGSYGLSDNHCFVRAAGIIDYWYFRIFTTQPKLLNLRLRGMIAVILTGFSVGTPNYFFFFLVEACLTFQ